MLNTHSSDHFQAFVITVTMVRECVDVSLAEVYKVDVKWTNTNT